MNNNLTKQIFKNINSLKNKPQTEKVEDEVVTLDSVDETTTYDKAIEHDNKSIAKFAVSAVLQMTETDDDDLDEGEGLGDRLRTIITNYADNGDGEITEEEQAGIVVAQSAIGEFLSSVGVSDDDVNSIVNDFDNDVADSVSEYLRGVLPEGEDATMDAVDTFIFDDLDCVTDAEGMTLDDAGVLTFDGARYKKMKSLVGGKVKWVKKKIGGTKKRMSAKQKSALKKTQRSGSAKKKRAKSMKKQFKLGLQGK